MQTSTCTLALGPTNSRDGTALHHRVKITQMRPHLLEQNDLCVSSHASGNKSAAAGEQSQVRSLRGSQGKASYSLRESHTRIPGEEAHSEVTLPALM